eukprot:4830921-Pyramimonas_sp.AAC.1
MSHRKPKKNLRQAVQQSRNTEPLPTKRVPSSGPRLYVLPKSPQHRTTSNADPAHAPPSEAR